MNNPLLLPVLDVLRCQPNGVSEYALLKQVEGDLPPQLHDATQEGGAELALFQKHFLIMNALYQLQVTLWREEQLWLSISPLSISLRSAIGASDRQALQIDNDDKLRDYYLDWSAFERTGSDEVRALLNGFWQRFHDSDQLASAFSVLEMPATDEWAQVQAQYRRLARAAHPDRGGDAARFLDIRMAYERLRRNFNVR